ncbi:L-asparaginase II [Rhodococcus sp. 27YEA15]|uniref:asparaginase n=1 Tax=Rhodococcus sp. 27YEA15 TaxID=3156259 RepID=UPI003C7A91DD
MSIELVEVVRSGFRECVHRGSAVIVDSGGEIVVAVGEVHTPLYPRSANKPLQAVAALRHGFEPIGPQELAISGASHSGQAEHIDLVAGILERHGLRADQLQCPSDLPTNPLARAELIAAGELPNPIYMTCSGKHASMLATCVVNDWPLASYMEPTHPLQLAIVQTLVDLSGEEVDELGIDGCGLPIVPLALTNLARAFGRLPSAAPGSPERAVADAFRAHPFLVSGSGANDERLMSAVPGLFSKTGYDGVYAGALPDGSAFALKIDDGHERALLPLAAALLGRMGVDWTEDLAALAAAPVIGGSTRVGTTRAIPGIF